MINAGYIPCPWDLVEDVVYGVTGIVDSVNETTGAVMLLTFGKSIKTHRAFLNLILRPGDPEERTCNNGTRETEKE